MACKTSVWSKPDRPTTTKIQRAKKVPLQEEKKSPTVCITAELIHALNWLVYGQKQPACSPTGCRWGSSPPPFECAFLPVSAVRSAAAAACDSLRHDGDVREQRCPVCPPTSVQSRRRTVEVNLLRAFLQPASISPAHSEGWSSLPCLRSCCASLCASLRRIAATLRNLISPTLMIQSITRTPVKLVGLFFIGLLDGFGGNGLGQ